MSSSIQSAPGYHLYYPQSETVAIRFSAEAQLILLDEVLSGFGAIPKRGAEVGGILLGREESGTLWIDEIAMIPCEHRRGPSFLLSETDIEALEQQFDKLRSGAGAAHPVGMFRSNTRDRDVVTDEDRQLFGKYFPAPSGVLMLVHPYATKAPTTFFVRYENNQLPDASEHVYPLLFNEPPASPAPVAAGSSGGAPWRSAAARSSGTSPTMLEPPRLELIRTEPLPAPKAEEIRSAAPVQEARAGSYRAKETVPEEPESAAPTVEPATRGRNWIWIPLSLIFLVLGVLLGFQAALSFHTPPSPINSGTFTLGLNTLVKGDHLHIQWDRESPAVRWASHGKLTIQDGQYVKSVDLDTGALLNGSVIYPPVTPNVNLRLEVATPSGSVISESKAWSKPQ